MASQARKHRGYRTQDIVAAWFAERGWENASSVGAGRTGADIVGLPKWARTHIEVKARGGFQPLSWLRQTGALAAAQGDAEAVDPLLASAGRPDTRAVVFRCNGQGPATVAQFGALLTLHDYTQLLIEAGRLPGGHNALPAD